MASEPIVELDARFSSPGAAPRPWSEVLGVIERNDIFWLSTVRRSGRPHLAPLPAIWLDGSLHLCTGEAEQKAVNLRHEPRCALATGSSAFLSGLDVVVEGLAERVVDDALLRRLAERWATKLDWTFEVVDGAFREPRSDVAGSDFEATGTAIVFGVAPTKVLAFGKGEPFSQTRYLFDR